MSAAGPSEAEYVQHGKEPSAGSYHSSNSNKSGNPTHNGTGQPNAAADEESFYDDEDDMFDEYTHERLPSSPQRLDLELPEANLDLTTTFNTILAEVAPVEEMDRVHKRASNVMKLAEQNERLKEELRAMTERLEAAERKQKDLESRAQRRSTEA